MKIRNFEYNGFFGRCLPGYAPYTGEFVEWTNDPGIAKFSCSDGKTRLIPSYAVEGGLPKKPDPDHEASELLYFGPSSSS